MREPPGRGGVPVLAPEPSKEASFAACGGGFSFTENKKEKRVKAQVLAALRNVMPGHHGAPLYLLMVDPHFCDGEHPAPIARFAPTNEGWKDAKEYARRKRMEGI